MNISTPVGFLISICVIFFAIKTGIKNPLVFLNEHAAIIVFGGTLSAALICLPISYFLNMFKVFLTTLLGARSAATMRTIDEIVELANLINQGRPVSEGYANVKTPFLKEGLELMESGALSEEELEDILDKRVEMQNERYKQNSLTFKMVGKFPPAFGLVGTTMGMIALLQSLGEPNAFDRLGPSMSIALVATFYGLILSNVILIPIGENLSQAAEEDLAMRRIVVEGVRLLRAQKHPLLVQEYLRSYLTPKERNKMKKAA